MAVLGSACMAQLDRYDCNIKATLIAVFTYLTW